MQDFTVGLKVLPHKLKHVQQVAIVQQEQVSQSHVLEELTLLLLKILSFLIVLIVLLVDIVRILD